MVKTSLNDLSDYTVLLLVLVATRVPDLVLNSTTDVTQSGGNALLQVTLAAGIGPLTFSMLMHSNSEV